MPRHADVEGLDAAQQQPCGMGIDDAAEHAEGLADGVDEFTGARHGSGEQVVMSAEVLRGAMQYEVGAVVERAMIHGRREG